MRFDFVIENFWFIALVVPFAILLYESIIVVGGNEMALLERRWFGRKMPQGRVVALGNEVGIQAKTHLVLASIS